MQFKLWSFKFLEKNNFFYFVVFCLFVTSFHFWHVNSSPKTFWRRFKLLIKNYFVSFLSRKSPQKKLKKTFLNKKKRKSVVKVGPHRSGYIQDLICVLHTLAVIFIPGLGGCKCLRGERGKVFWKQIIWLVFSCNFTSKKN